MPDDSKEANILGQISQVGLNPGLDRAKTWFGKTWSRPGLDQVLFWISQLLWTGFRPKCNFHNIIIKKGQFLNQIVIQIIGGTSARLYLQYYVYYADRIYVRVQLTRLLISDHTINN